MLPSGRSASLLPWQPAPVQSGDRQPMVLGVCTVLRQMSLTGGRWLNMHDARQASCRVLASSRSHGPWRGTLLRVELEKAVMALTSSSAAIHLPDSSMSPMSFLFLGTCWMSCCLSLLSQS